MTAKLKQAPVCDLKELFDLIGDDAGKAERVLRLMGEIIARRERASRRKKSKLRTVY